MSQARSSIARSVAAHGVLILWTVIALFPVFVTVVNSFKTRKAIFAEPLALPGPESFDLIGYATVLKQGYFFQYFLNSMTVTVGSLFFVLLFGAMAAFALSEYRFKGNTLLGLYLALGIMIPIRLGTVANQPFATQASPSGHCPLSTHSGAFWLLQASKLINSRTACIRRPRPSRSCPLRRRPRCSGSSPGCPAPGWRRGRRSRRPLAHRPRWGGACGTSGRLRRACPWRPPSR